MSRHPYGGNVVCVQRRLRYGEFVSHHMLRKEITYFVRTVCLHGNDATSKTLLTRLTENMLFKILLNIYVLVSHVFFFLSGFPLNTFHEFPISLYVLYTTFISCPMI
jgi:hypothetical protein